MKEAFISNTSSEVTPVIELGGNTLGDGVPGQVTKMIQNKFNLEIIALKG